VPQLLGKNAEDFLWAAQALADMGYREVNLNLGCPSSTVTAKGKGSGFLAHPDELDRFLDAIYSAAPLAISIKTRLGLAEPEEFLRLLPIYEKYPVHELTIHPRTKTQMYQGDVYWDSFAWALEHTALPLCYNGNLFTQADCQAFQARFPQVDRLMLGRGLVTDPALVARMGGQDASRARLRQFHDALCQEYPVVFESQQNAMHRMKAIWAYMLAAFQGGEGYRKKIIKARHWADLMAVADEIFSTLPLLEGD
jgi:tRNA-dihydrouridine synthase